jgi:hypothetical protein
MIYAVMWFIEISSYCVQRLWKAGRHGKLASGREVKHRSLFFNFMILPKLLQD